MNKPKARKKKPARPEAPLFPSGKPSPEVFEFLLRHLATLRHLWERHNQVKKRYGLQPPQLGILYHLYGLGPMFLSKLRWLAPGHLSSVTQMITRMEEHGWVRRRRDERDRRRVLIEITDKARRAIEEIEPFGLPRAIITFIGMSPKERRMAVEAAQIVAGLFGVDPETYSDVSGLQADLMDLHDLKGAGR